jgi:hypothetical protein
MYPNPFYNLQAYNALRAAANIDTEEDSSYSPPPASYAPPSPRISPVYRDSWLPSPQAMAVPSFSISSVPLPSFFHTSHFDGSFRSSYNQEVHSRTVGSRTITLKGPLGCGNGCVVSCIAMVAGISLSEALRYAIDIVGFEPGGDGLSFREGKEILDALDIESTRYLGTFDWQDSNSADLAIVSVNTSGERHAVVCITTNLGVTIFDSNYPYPRSPRDYVFSENDAYLEIDH